MSDITLNIQNNIGELLKEVKSLTGELNKLSSGYKTLSQSVNGSNNSLKSAYQNWEQINKVAKQYEEQSKASQQADKENWDNGIKKINEYYNSYKKLVTGVASLSLRMANSAKTTALGMSPISPSEFSSGFSLNPKTLFGFGEAMKGAFGMMKEMQQMRHDLAYLSNDAGDAGKALSTVFNIASGSAISRSTSLGVVRALADQGLRLEDASGKASPKIERLGKLAGDLQAATGVAASQWGSFTGELSFNYGLTEDGLANVTSALVGTGLGAQQLERSISSINKVLQTTAFIAGVPTERSVLGLTKAVGGAIKVFNKFNISSEKAATLIEGILDPENFQKNSYLFAKLGIGASEYAGYLNDANGQQMLLEKVMGNLPQLANEVANIQNPFARMEIAKSLGLDMQTVRRFASSSKSEIEQIMKEYVAANKNQEALDKKKKKMAAEAAKYDDFIFGLKMKVLAPIMKMLSSGMLDKFMSLMPSLAQSMANVFTEIMPIATMIMNGLASVAPTIGLFIQRIGGAIGWLFDKAGGQSGIVNFLSDKYDDATQNGNSFLESFSDIASILSKIYLAVKAVQIGKFFLDTAKSLGGFVGSAFNKAIGWIMPSKKLIINATVGDLAEAIGKEVKPGLGGTQGGGIASFLLGNTLLALGGVGLGSLLFKSIFGEKSTKELSNLQNLTTEEGRNKQEKEAYDNFYKDVGERIFKTTGAATVLGGRLLYQAGKTGIQEGLTAAQNFALINKATGTAITNSQIAMAGAGGFKQAGGRVLTQGASRLAVPLSAALNAVDWYNVFTSEKTGMAKTFEVIGASAGTVATGALISGLTLTATGVGFAPGALAFKTALIASIVSITSNLLSDFLDERGSLEQRKKTLDVFGKSSAELKKMFFEQEQEIKVLTEEKEFNKSGQRVVTSADVKYKELNPSDYENFEAYKIAQEAQITSIEKQVLEGSKRQSIIGSAEEEKKIGGRFAEAMSMVDYTKFLENLKSVEKYETKKLAIAALSLNELQYQQQFEISTQNVAKQKGINIEQAKALLEKEVESTKFFSETIEAKKIALKQFDTIGNTIKNLFQAFQFGQFDRIARTISKIFEILKINLILFVEGFSTSSAEKIFKNFFGGPNGQISSIDNLEYKESTMLKGGNLKEFLDKKLTKTEIDLAAFSKETPEEKKDRQAKEASIEAQNKNTAAVDKLNTTMQKNATQTEREINAIVVESIEKAFILY